MLQTARWLSFVIVGLVLMVLHGSASAQEPTMVPIFALQGSGVESPYLGQDVTTEGVVVADFVDTAHHGFYLQDPEGDDDPATSDGIWVYHQRWSGEPLTVAVGEVVTVSGEVSEYFGFTEIVLDTLEPVATGEPLAPVQLDPPSDAAAAATYLEAREGMLVSLPPSRVVGATNTYGDSYVMPLASGIGRLYRPSADGRRIGLMFPDEWGRLDHGDIVEDVVGGLAYNYENYKVVVPGDPGPSITRSGRMPPSAAPSREGELTLATYNLENLFDTFDDPAKNDTEWTPSPELYAKRLAVRARSIAEGLGAPDIVGVQEVETLVALSDLAAQPLLAGANYGASLIEGPDGRGIDVGFLYNRDRLTLLAADQRQACAALGPTADLDIACDMPDGTPGHILFGRPPLLARFEVIETGAELAVIVNHFKSKRGGDAVTQPVRTAMAEHNLELVRELKAQHPEATVIVMGDLNDFEDTPPITTLSESALLRDLLPLVAPEEDYTYIFNGVSQNLDYILVETDATVLDFGPIHVNTDFGSVPEAELSAAAQRASDHDPLLLRIPVPAGPGPRIYLPLATRNGMPVTDDRLRTPPPPTSTRPPAPTSTPRSTAPASPTTDPIATTTPSAGAPPRTPLRIDDVFFNGAINPNEPDEYVTFANVSGDAVDMTGWRLISVRGSQVYDFPDGFVIDAAQTCRVYTGEDHPEHCGLNWQSSGALWRNSGDKAELRDAAGMLIDWFCYADHEGQCG